MKKSTKQNKNAIPADNRSRAKLVEIKLCHKSLSLVSDDCNEDELQLIAGQLEERINAIQNTNSSISFEMALIIVSLTMQQELQNLQHQLYQICQNNPIPVQGDDMANKLLGIAAELEDLAKVFRK